VDEASIVIERDNMSKCDYTGRVLLAVCLGATGGGMVGAIVILFQMVFSDMPWVNLIPFLIALPILMGLSVLITKRVIRRET